MFFVLMIIGGIIFFSLAYGALSAAPWVPTRRYDIPRLIKLTYPGPSDIVYELGCGDARVLAEVVHKTNARGVGIEVSLLQWFIASFRSLGTAGKMQIKWNDLFRVDFSEATIVYFFLMPEAHLRIREKLERELRPGMRVVTYVWPMPGWEPVLVDKQEGRHAMYVYVIGEGERG